MSIDEIISGLQGYENSLLKRAGLSITYELVRSEDVAPAKFSDARILAEFKFAYNRTKTLSIRRFTRPSTVKGAKIPGEPVTYLVNNGRYLEWDASRQVASLDTLTQPFDNLSNAHEYTKNLGFDAYEAVSKITGKSVSEHRLHCDRKFLIPFLLDSVRENREKYRVYKDPIEINGMRCWKVEWFGMDSFAVDPSHGFAVPWRLIHWAPNEPQRYEFLQSDYREVSPGLWLPFVQLKKTFASKKESMEIWGRVTTEHSYVVRSVEVDNIPETFFDIKLPANAVVFDHTQNINYRIPSAGADPFQLAIQEGKALLPRDGFPWRVLILGIVACVFALFYLWRRRRVAFRLNE